MEFVSSQQRRPVQALGARHIQIRFIDRNHLHLWRKGTQYLASFLRTFTVAVRMAIDKNRLRAELGRSAERHGRMHSELARFIRSSRNHATFMALASDDDGLSFKVGIE